VWFVPLAGVRGALDVPQAVLVAIGIPETVRLLEAREITQPLDRLVDALAAKRLILVLDNCEHLIDAVARLADRLLSAAPGVRILTTSREPVGITGESLCPVPALALPPEDADAESAQEFEAVRLFADRAAAVRPGFALDADTVEPVVRICRALDGTPLAIELAAARLRALTPAQVADRLDDRFRLLNVGSRTALPRHQTLRAVVDWSWELLDDAERRVLRRLSVFSGGATPESAEQVLGDDVIDVIASLVDKSLVMATGNAEVRYHLLETVRAYAAERLAEAGEEKQLRDAHATYFRDLAERAEPELRRHDQLFWADRLTAERDNCTTALRHAIDTRDAEMGLRLVGGLAWFWILRDYEAEAGQWAVAVWKIADDTPPPGRRERLRDLWLHRRHGHRDDPRGRTAAGRTARGGRHRDLAHGHGILASGAGALPARRRDPVRRRRRGAGPARPDRGPPGPVDAGRQARVPRVPDPQPGRHRPGGSRVRGGVRRFP
jgi:predicted ATPase